MAHHILICSMEAIDINLAERAVPTLAITGINSKDSYIDKRMAHHILICSMEAIDINLAERAVPTLAS